LIHYLYGIQAVALAAARHFANELLETRRVVASSSLIKTFLFQATLTGLKMLASIFYWTYLIRSPQWLIPGASDLRPETPKSRLNFCISAKLRAQRCIEIAANSQHEERNVQPQLRVDPAIKKIRHCSGLHSDY